MNGPVQLACASCHETDASEHAQSVDRRAANTGEPRTPGAYMLPIVYENHCAACHPLQFDAKLPDVQARHGIRAQEVLTELRQLYTAEAVKADPDLLRQFVPPRTMPGQASSRANQLIQQAVDEKVLTAARLLFGAALDENVRRQAEATRWPKRLRRVPRLETDCRADREFGVTSALEIEPPLMTPVWQSARSVQSPDASRARLRRVPRRCRHFEGRTVKSPFCQVSRMCAVPRAGRRPPRERARRGKHGMHRVPPVS